MNKMFTILSLALCLSAMGCGGTVASSVQCESSTDCNEGCAGYDSATCSAEGRCYCNDIQEDRGCDLDTDCTEGCTDYDMHSCSGGMCICMNEIAETAVVVTGNGPAASTVSLGTSDVDVQFISLTADADLTVRDTRLGVHVYNDSGTLVSTADESAYGLLRNLKVVDLDTGSTLSGPLTTVDQAERREVAGQVWYSKVTSEDYELTGGVTKYLTVRLDVVDAAFPVGYSFDVEVCFVPENGGDSYFYDYAELAYVGKGNIVGACQLSSRMTVTADIIVSLNPNTEPSSTLPKGATRVQLSSFDFTAGEQAVVINSFVITRGGVGQVSDWAGLFLYDDEKRLTVRALLSGVTNSIGFPLGMAIAANTTTTIYLVGDVSATAGANNQHY